jgi:hypothetical protein
MKTNKFLFVFIIIVILCILFYCFQSKIIETLESTEESNDNTEESNDNTEENIDDPELTKKQSGLQEIINNFTGTLSKQIKDMINTQTSEGNKKVDSAIEKENELVQQIESEEDTTDEEFTKKIKNLINIIDMDVKKYNASIDSDINHGISIEIGDQDKIQSIFNKYLNQ